MDLNITINSLEEMNELAKKISSYVKKGFIIGLKGELGSGKTTFTKFLALHLGVLENVNSPTFTILKIYQGRIPIYHMDVYRLENIGYDYELDDFIYGDGVSIIEWYPYILEMLPKNILSIEIVVLSENIREVHIEGSEEYAKVVEALSN